MRVPEVSAARGVVWNPSLPSRQFAPPGMQRQEERAQGPEPADPRGAYDRPMLEQLTDGLNRTLKAFDKRLQFLVHEETERIYVKVIDAETGEVIREIPPEKILDLVGHIQQLLGLLIDEWA
ncbi:MAG: flagellar protein FlaG [Limnochordales bacterium]